MGNVKPLKADMTAMQNLLEQEEIDGEEVTLESMAKAVFDLAFQVYESRGKFAVAAQLYDYGRAGEIRRVLDGDKPARIVMGPYTSEATAKTAGDALWRSNATDEQWAWWIIPMYHGTPAAFHTGRKLESQTAGYVISDNPCNKVVEQSPGEWVAYCVRDEDHQGLCRPGERVSV